MQLDKIVSIPGKPGLFEIITQTRAGFVAQSLVDGKKISIAFKNNISVLNEIAIYTLDEEVPLKEVFQKIWDKENGSATYVSHKADKDALEAYFFEVLPNFDEDRVYPSDIKKVLQWYNMLLEKNLLAPAQTQKDEPEIESAPGV